MGGHLEMRDGRYSVPGASQDFIPQNVPPDKVVMAKFPGKA